MCTSEHVHVDAARRGAGAAADTAAAAVCDQVSVIKSAQSKRPASGGRDRVRGWWTCSYYSTQLSSQTRLFSSGHAARRDNGVRLRKQRAAAETLGFRRVSCKTEYRIRARIRPATSGHGQQETSQTCAQDARARYPLKSLTGTGVSTIVLRSTV